MKRILIKILGKKQKANFWEDDYVATDYRDIARKLHQIPWWIRCWDYWGSGTLWMIAYIYVFIGRVC